MLSVRELLDCLGRATLVRLIHGRNLAASRENEERRKTLAHSYRGDAESLLEELTRQELVEIFRQVTFDIGGQEMYLANPGKYRFDELLAFGRRAFAGRRVKIPGEFRLASELETDVAAEDDDDDDQADSEAGEGDDDDGGEIAAGMEDVADEDQPDGGVRIRLGEVTSEWSRPRQVDRLLRVAGIEVPHRLRAERFRELLDVLHHVGLEACLADDPTATPLASTADSPGIAAKLRLRTAREGRVRDRGEVNEAAAALSSGPSVVLQLGEPPVGQRRQRAPDYDLAILRLQFLTAVPSVQRRSMPEWPDGYIAAATRGLRLRPEELRLLKPLAAGLCMGTHSPYDSIPLLSQFLQSDQWEELIGDFSALNPFQLEVVAALIEQVRPVRGKPTNVVGMVVPAPAPADLQQATNAGVKAEPVAASSRRSTAPDGTNHRDLGALSGMFDDE